MTQEKMVRATKVLRLLFLAAAIAGAVRAIFFVFDPNIGMGLLITPFMALLLAGAFFLSGFGHGKQKRNASTSP